MPIPLPTYGNYCGNGRMDGGTNDAVQIANDLGIEATIDNLIWYHAAPIDALDMACLAHDLGGIGDNILQDILTDIKFAYEAFGAAADADTIYGKIYGYLASALSLTTFTVWHAVVDTLALVKDAASWAIDFAGGAFDWMGDTIGGVVDAVGDVAEAFWDWGVDFANDAWDFVSGVFESAWDIASDFFGGIADFFGDVFNDIGNWFGYHFPIVLDLDGDGVQLTSIHQGVHIDVNGDGDLEQVAWVSSGDGILAYDVNGDGLADGQEISFVQWLEGAKSDLEGLSHFDSNGDGKLDAGDTAYAGFLVWRDLDGDGVSEAGETQSLGDAGVESIALALNGETFDSGGSQVLNTTTFTTVDGETLAAWDVALGVLDRDAPAPAAANDEVGDAATQLAFALASAELDEVDGVEAAPAVFFDELDQRLVA